MQVGYQYQSNFKTTNPLDHMDDPETGLRPGQKVKASGMVKIYLDRGINEWTALPPVAIWDAGTWLTELTKEQQKLFIAVTEAEKFNCWVCSGQGTPGNYIARGYILPGELCAAWEPDHPFFWPDAHRSSPVVDTPRNKGGWSFGFNDDDHHAWSGNGVKTLVPPAKAAPPVATLPINIRFRCVECGHWFKEDQLPKHKMHTCPGKEASGTSDWTLLCECCHSLDESAMVKPGFPRPKKEVATKTEEEAEEAVADGSPVAPAA